MSPSFLTCSMMPSTVSLTSSVLDILFWIQYSSSISFHFSGSTNSWSFAAFAIMAPMSPLLK